MTDPDARPPLDPHITRAVIACSAVVVWLIVDMVQSRDQMAHTSITSLVGVLLVAGLTFGLYHRNIGAAMVLVILSSAAAVNLVRFDGSRVANYSAIDTWGRVALSAIVAYLVARAALVIVRAQPFPPPPRE